MGVETLISAADYLRGSYHPDRHFVTEGEPEGQIFTAPPLACIEILSRRDSLSDLQEVIDDCLSIGVSYCWIINPWKRIAYSCSTHGLDKVMEGALRSHSPHHELVIPLEELWNS